MKKNFLITENNYLSLVKSLIMENNSNELRMSDLTKSQWKDIENKGVAVLENIKKFSKETEEGKKDINHWLIKHGLLLRRPSEKDVRTNIDDLEFAIKNLPLQPWKRNALEEKLSLFKQQEENPQENVIVLFYEVQGDDFRWSYVNLYDTNIIFWLRLMNKRYGQISKLNIGSIVQEYFGDLSVNTLAAKDMFQSMVNDRQILSKQIFEKTWGGGRDVEIKFVKHLISLGIAEDDIQVFGGEGNWVDRFGIDLAFKFKNSYIPVQVKSKKDSAQKTVPYMGISVYPENSKFFVFDGGDNPIELKEFLSK